MYSLIITITLKLPCPDFEFIYYEKNTLPGQNKFKFFKDFTHADIILVVVTPKFLENKLVVLKKYAAFNETLKDKLVIPLMVGTKDVPDVFSVDERILHFDNFKYKQQKKDFELLQKAIMTAVVYDERMGSHYHMWNNDFTEKPERFTGPFKRCREYGLLERCQNLQSRMATEEEMKILHSEDLIKLLKKSTSMTDEEMKETSRKYDFLYFHKSINISYKGCVVDRCFILTKCYTLKNILYVVSLLYLKGKGQNISLSTICIVISSITIYNTFNNGSKNNILLIFFLIFARKRIFCCHVRVYVYLDFVLIQNLTIDTKLYIKVKLN
ncbi:hypothetical protein KUTeg_005110 [Tegillarca granosa]|uniref:Uncharacterized protein n=1 Tax=Tegillarca granosa TaxID=220873 RepID=A0ABQ9FKK6_TEGGR|nr:hypothetical protein KUTeg_005110 [Tegillarca granosa]